MGRNGVQLIDFDGRAREGAAAYLAQKGFYGTDYSTIGIIGSQNSGKSTLLNLLFGTQFDVLDVNRGRFQTTKGINLSACSEHRIVIIDTEGTDSAERGEDGLNFEHQSALFTLAVSDVLLVNLWTSELGRYKAASIGVLRTVFEASLRLLGETMKRRLVFVFRDYHSEHNNFALLTAQLQSTMQEIWSEVQPGKQVSDFFELAFAALASKEFEWQLFLQGVCDLKSTLIAPHPPSPVPIDGLDLYYPSLWSTITSDSSLNLPSHRALLSHLRCRQIQTAILQACSHDLSPLRKQAVKAYIPNLGRRGEEKLQDAIDRYDTEAAGYSSQEADRIHTELETDLLAELKDIYRMQLEYLQTAALRSFDRAILGCGGRSMGSPALPDPQFPTQAESSAQTVLQAFTQRAEAGLVHPSDWTYASELADLQGKLAIRLTELADRQRHSLERYIAGAVAEGVGGAVGKAFQRVKAGEEFWQRVESSLLACLDTIETGIAAVMTGLRGTREETDGLILNMRRSAVETLYVKVEKHTVKLAEVLQKRFDGSFWRDARGIPRNWAKTDPKAVVSPAKDAAFGLLATFEYFPIGDSPRLLLCGAALDHIRNCLNSHISESYEKAIALQRYSVASGGSLPVWFVIALCVCGLNELWWVVSYPLVGRVLAGVVGVVAGMKVMGLEFLLRHWAHLGLMWVGWIH